MKTALAILLIGLSGVSGFAGAAAAPGEWRCHLPPTAVDRAERTTLVYPDRAMVREVSVDLTDGMTSASMPDLLYFVRVEPDHVSWGARNTRTASIYYRYDMHTTTGALTYRAEGVDAPAGHCEHIRN